MQSTLLEVKDFLGSIFVSMVEMTETRLCWRNEINKKKPEEQPASRNGEKKTEIYERETKKAGLERRQEGIREKRG